MFPPVSASHRLDATSSEERSELPRVWACNRSLGAALGPREGRVWRVLCLRSRRPLVGEATGGDRIEKRSKVRDQSGSDLSSACRPEQFVFTLPGELEVGVRVVVVIVVVHHDSAQGPVRWAIA